MIVEIMVTDDKNVGPDRWRHVEARGFADTEAEARRTAHAVKEMFLPDAYDLYERVPFEYSAGHHGWNLYGRFSFREQK